ncbi:MAG: hypothetical protein FRX49_07102 [Trebouxia sp. A1-2]|nr:MAG: hypothetical protein FRX49_07102 [Trebouxia sp. A1-2]
MSDTQPEPTVQHTESYEEQRIAESDAADEPDAIPKNSSDPTDSTGLQPEFHAAKEPAGDDTETDSAESQLSSIAGGGSSNAVQSAEADADSIGDSRPGSVQQSDVGQQDVPDALPNESAVSASHQQTPEDRTQPASTADGYDATQAEVGVNLLQDPMIEDEPQSALASSRIDSAEQEVPAAYAAALSNPELDPDHPLLARAQNALAKQLLAIKYRLESDVREKAVALQHAKTRREAIGVELYNFQQQLAKMQMQLEKAQENFAHISHIRRQAEEQLNSLQKTHAEEEQLTAQEKLKVEKVQNELDGLAATLKQVELYNEQMKSEIAVTRRATYAAEQSVQKLEKGKKDQDLLIDHLQQQLRTHEQQIAIYSQQYDAQKRETRAAKEMLAGAEAEMEGIHFEKKQLTAQWQSSLIATQRRDQALRALEDAITEQHEQERSIENEIDAYRKDIVREQIRNEQLTAVMTKLEGESGFLQTQNDTMVRKQEKLQEMYVKLQHELSLAEEKLRKAYSQGKLLESDRKILDVGIAKANNSIKAVEAKVLENLSEQTTAEKSAAKTAQDIKALRKQVYDEEMLVVQLQNELARLEVDILHTQGRNLRLKQAMQLLNEDIDEKMQTIGKYEADLKQRAFEIEKKTKEVDLLNRKYEKLKADPEAGPLEAVVNNLTREIQGKGEEGRELQRRWVGWQTELVGLQAENNRLAQDLQRLKAHHTITHHKRTRLRQQHDMVLREVKDLEKGIAHLHNCMARYNALIADNAGLKAQLVNDNFHLETKISHELKDMEEAAAKLSGSIDASRQDKSQLLSDIVETEKQVMLWQRKIELEREMNDVLDPSVGGDVVEGDPQDAAQGWRAGSHPGGPAAGSGALNRQKGHHCPQGKIGCLLPQLRLGCPFPFSHACNQSWHSPKYRLSRDIHMGAQGRAATMKQIPDITEQALKKALGELERSIRDTKRESRATDERVASMDSQRAQLADEVASANDRVDELQQQEAAIRALLMTSGQQKMAKCYEDAGAGRYKSRASPSVVDSELRIASDKQQKIVAALTASMEQSPDLRPALERILLRAVAVQQ